MKLTIKHITLMLVAFAMTAGSVFAQQGRELQYYTYPDQRGLNQFEAPFYTDVEFDGLNIIIGGSNTLQFQGLTQENDANSLTDLESNFNLATSNLDFNVALANGVRMHLRTYLSSQHHPEAWVKGGYLQVDRLDFIQEGLASNLMDKVRIKVGHMEINYGDAHFRRTDNAQAIHNPFVGNYLMDSFSTEVAGELYYSDNGFLAMFGLSNGKLNQDVIDTDPTVTPNVYGKIGYDSQINEDLRFRLTGSFITSSESGAFYLYSGDRAGTRYYSVMSGSDFAGRIDPGYTVSRFNPIGPISGEATAFMINPFIKFQGLEFFGVFETVSGKTAVETEDRVYNQYGAELLYRFGAGEDLYIGGRYNLVTGERGVTDVPNNTVVNAGDVDITRVNIGGGWFLTKNVLAKFEYVKQTYDGEGFDGSLFQGGEFDGVMIEAVISF